MFNLRPRKFYPCELNTGEALALSLRFAGFSRQNYLFHILDMKYGYIMRYIMIYILGYYIRIYYETSALGWIWGRN